MFSQRTAWKLTPNRFAAALEKHRAAGKEVLDLTASNPTTCGFHYNQDAILAALADPGSLRYCPAAKGLTHARGAVARYYEERGDAAARVENEQIILTASTSEAYSFLFRLLCEPGDEVLVPAPSYPLFEYLADLQDVRLVRYPLLYDHGWQVDFHSLESAITPRSRAVMVVHPNNPTGSFLKAAEQAELKSLCAGRELAIVADEVFLDYPLDGVPRFSFVSTRAALTFTLSGLSKIPGLPQMKLAWLVAGGPGELVREALNRLEVIADTYLSVGTPVQLAAPTMLGQRHGIQTQICARVRANLEELDRQLYSQSLCRRLEVEGGWYTVLRVPVTRSGEDLAIALLAQRSVLVHPGHFYDFSAEGYLVVSLITPEQQFREGIKRLLEFLA